MILWLKETPLSHIQKTYFYVWLQTKEIKIRELGFWRIIKARILYYKRKAIRSFQPSKIYFQETKWINMINRSSSTLSSPLMLWRVTNEEIYSKIKSGETTEKWNFHKFLYHKQAVEAGYWGVSKSRQSKV